MNAADRQRPPPGELYLDHVSHFVADLDAAARVCEALGLRVTPTSVQRTPEGPVGASNRCVMLEAGYIELLSPTHDTPAAARMRALMRRYEGVQLVCFGTRAAVAKLLGEAPPPPAIAGYALGGGQPKTLLARCKEAGVAVQKCGARHAAKLPAALGSVWLIG